MSRWTMRCAALAALALVAANAQAQHVRYDQMRPGEHTFAVDGQQIPLLVQPGRSYFVRVAGAAGAPRLSRSTPIAFLSATGSRPMPQM